MVLVFYLDRISQGYFKLDLVQIFVDKFGIFIVEVIFMRDVVRERKEFDWKFVIFS